MLWGQNVTSKSYYFETNQFTLSKKSLLRFSEDFNNLKGKQITLIKIEGYTDTDGNEEFNLKLSKKRAFTIRSLFLENGIDSSIINLAYFGEQKPIESLTKDKNRRVEITITFKELYNENIFNYLKKDSQLFNSNPNNKITIIGKEGTIINIPKNAFLRKNGVRETDDIKIELKEFYKKSDIVSNNLHTMSNKEILETAGMIYISSKSKHGDLRLVKDMEIQFGNNKKIESMQTFISEEGDEKLNWIPEITIPEPESQGDTLIREKASANQIIINEGRLKSQQIIKYMVLKTRSLGWINCDKFYNLRSSTSLLVKTNEEESVVLLVFKDINSVVNGDKVNNNMLRFENIPKNQNAILICFSLKEDEFYFGLKEITTGQNQIVEMNFQKTTIEKIKKELLILNN